MITSPEILPKGLGMAESIESASRWRAGDRQDHANVIYPRCGRGEGGSAEVAPEGVGHFPPGTSKWDKIEHRLAHLDQLARTPSADLRDRPSSTSGESSPRWISMSAGNFVVRGFGDSQT